MVSLGVNISNNLYANPAMSDCYIEACRVLACGYSGISTVNKGYS